VYSFLGANLVHWDVEKAFSEEVAGARISRLMRQAGERARACSYGDSGLFYRHIGGLQQLTCCRGATLAFSHRHAQFSTACSLRIRSIRRHDFVSFLGQGFHNGLR
jgi:hypothetical protein